MLRPVNFFIHFKPCSNSLILSNRPSGELARGDAINRRWLRSKSRSLVGSRRSGSTRTSSRKKRLRGAHKPSRTTSGKKTGKGHSLNAVDSGYPKNPYKHEQKQNSIAHLLQGDLFTPEATGVQNLARNLSHALRVGLQDSELIKRYARRATVLSHTLRPRDVALLLNCFSKAEFYDPTFVNAALRALCSQLHDATPQTIALTLHALGSQDAACKSTNEVFMLERVFLDIPHKLPHFNEQDLVLTVTALPRLKIKDLALYDDLCLEISRREKPFEAFQVGALAYALGSAQVSHQKVWEKLAHDFLALTPIDSTTVEPMLKFVLGATNAFNELKSSPLVLCDCLASIAKFIAQHQDIVFRCLRPHGWLRAFQGFARVGYQDAELYHKFLSRVIRLSNLLQKSDIRLLLLSVSHLYTRRLLHDAALVDKLLHQLVPAVKPLLPQLPLSAIIAFFVAYSNSTVRDLGVIKDAMLRLDASASTLEPYQLVLAAESLEKWGIRSVRVLRALMAAASQKMPLFHMHDLLRFAQTLADFQVTSPKFVVATAILTRVQISDVSRSQRTCFVKMLEQHVQLLPPDLVVQEAVEQAIAVLQEEAETSSSAPPVASDGAELQLQNTHQFAGFSASSQKSTLSLPQSILMEAPLFGSRPAGFSSCTRSRMFTSARKRERGAGQRAAAALVPLKTTLPAAASQDVLSRCTAANVGEKNDARDPFLIVRSTLASRKPGYISIPSCNDAFYRDVLRRKGGLGVRRLFNRLMQHR